MDKLSLQKYVNTTNEYLKSRGTRPLTDKEREIVLKHLLEVADKYDPAISKARDLVTLLCLEATKKVCEIHPDMETPTKKQIIWGEARASKEFDPIVKQIEKRKREFGRVRDE